MRAHVRIYCLHQEGPDFSIGKGSLPGPASRPCFKALLAWAAVAIPLFWGLWITLKSVVALF
ncbi:MFS transporter small subunit [Labrys neptuniae]